ncbi:universal stress protein [Rhodococcus sp. PvP104]|uniref:universal stress protein n=1 Tax=Rhodococcus sp. PvP104 TaxID=2817911 RepID=UPI001AE6BD94|nr:universal stress protein [Rhodococcus sp. PvP104]MBP2527282.1 nucleotide-binding universal stress UspA family protein [Rhodococcus sp. PvP104]
MHSQHNLSRTARSPLTCHLQETRSHLPAAGHIVVGFGSGGPSSNALTFAADFAAKQGAALHVVHCIDVEDMPAETDSPYYEYRFHQAVTAQRDRALTILHTFTGNWTYDCHRAEPAQYLMTVADTYGAFVIVIGAPRLGAVSAAGTLFHTSVSSRLARQNRYPLLLIPATASAAMWPDKST